MIPKFASDHVKAVWLCLLCCCLHSGASHSAEDVVVHITSEPSFFTGWRLHLPAHEELADSRQVAIEGQLIGFEGDYLPLSMGENQIRLSDGPVEAGTESFFITLLVSEPGITVVDTRLRSTLREIVSWEDPEISQVQGSESFFQVRIKNPTLRTTGDAEIAPAMAGIVKMIRLSLKSIPQGSEIYLNNEEQSYSTNTKLSVPYMDGEREKRYLIRNKGLVNCYGAVRLPRESAEVECKHRNVRVSQ